MYTTYVARQPIFNAKKHTLGYELLFRDGEQNAFPRQMDSDRATYRLIVENFLSIGTNPSIEYSRCFINFPYKSLLRRLPLTLPKEQIVVEVLETCPPTDELFAAILDLSQRGYLIALDDFVYSAEWERFLPYVHIVKLDVIDMGIEQACRVVEQRLAAGSKRRFLAEKVETQEQFDLARRAGFSFFQGYFFSKPQVIKQRYLSPEQLISMRLFQEVCRPSVDFERVEQIISQDLALSYKLLHFVNRLSPRLAVPIASFRQALVYLGHDQLKTFVALTVASYVSVKKPQELYHLSLQRAQFCQRMSKRKPFDKYQDQAFLIGLFSVLDALFDTPLDHLLEQLPVTQAIKQALNKREGPFGQLLNLEECFEQADWQGIESHCTTLGIAMADVTQELKAAQLWSQKVRRC
ncbi:MULTISPECIES: EAL and HDOD domain-containing protein [unclassified Vibrio]|uniref:EAL and HDOD domain-containing protein n=1 Tax=unclassified Vibrio TaxID=2614977 RepID=UPI00148247E7|nr:MULTISPECIES: EAL and HDOD domain-containing protein [unclassified Vibrio]NNN46022.1 HDOD domain-containing protein [Vibrio sp. 1-1(7)]NNN73912.1 HDOD domain-containing protein [Vibrio sp. 12-2(3-a)]